MTKPTSTKSTGKLSKKELKQDKLVEFAYRAEHFYYQHQKWVISVAVAIVVIVAGAILINKAVKSSRLEESYQLTLAKMQMDSGRMDDARDALNRLVSSGSSAIAGEAKFLMGRIAFEQKNYSQAADYFAAYTKDYSVDVELDCAALSGLAASHQAMGKTDDAVKEYGEVASKYPDSNCAPQALWETFRIYRDLKQMDKAETALRELRDKYPEATIASMAKRELDGLAYSAR